MRFIYTRNSLSASLDNFLGMQTASLSEALAGVTPIEWSDDVLSGKKKVIVNKAQKEDNACVRLEISYL